jgi:hypothetical protein
MNEPGLDELQPGTDWWTDDSTTTLLREQKGAGIRASVVNKIIAEMERGEYPHGTHARLEREASRTYGYLP